MTDITVYRKIPDNVAAPTPARPRVLLIGTALACISAIMGLGSLVAFYAAVRQDVIQSGETWLPSGVTIPLTQPNMMMLTLWFSILIMVWATYSLGVDDRSNMHIALGLIVLMGFGYIAQTMFLLEIMNLGAASDSRASLIYAVIGAHVVYMAIAMLFVAFMGIRTLGGDYSARDREGIYAAAMFWYVGVFLYMIVWLAIYITK